jgi:hypothetical protein
MTGVGKENMPYRTATPSTRTKSDLGGERDSDLRLWACSRKRLVDEN